MTKSFLESTPLKITPLYISWRSVAPDNTAVAYAMKWNDDGNRDIRHLHIWFLHVCFFHSDTFVWRPLGNNVVKWTKSCERCQLTKLKGHFFLWMSDPFVTDKCSHFIFWTTWNNYLVSKIMWTCLLERSSRCRRLCTRSFLRDEGNSYDQPQWQRARNNALSQCTMLKGGKMQTSISSEFDFDFYRF